MADAAAVETRKPESRRTEKVGNVVSTKMQKTIVVEVEMRKTHPKYKRVIKLSKKFYAHDEQNSARVGDVVRIRESRPLSKLKRWTLEEVVRRSSLPQSEELAQPVAYRFRVSVFRSKLSDLSFTAASSCRRHRRLRDRCFSRLCKIGQVTAIVT